MDDALNRTIIPSWTHSTIISQVRRYSWTGGRVDRWIKDRELNIYGCTLKLSSKLQMCSLRVAIFVEYDTELFQSARCTWSSPWFFFTRLIEFLALLLPFPSSMLKLSNITKRRIKPRRTQQGKHGTCFITSHFCANRSQKDPVSLATTSQSLLKNWNLFA